MTQFLILDEREQEMTGATYPSLLQLTQPSTINIQAELKDAYEEKPDLVEEVGIIVAERLIHPSVKTFLQLPDGYEIAEISAPKGIKNMTIEKIEFDEHTVPQSDFLLQPKRNDNNTRTIRYYDLETDGLEKLNNKFNWFKEIPLHYSATDFPAKVQFKEKLDKVIDKRLIKKVKQFYSSDYDLRERVFRL